MAYKLSPITDRVARIREMYRTVEPEICIARYKIITEFYMGHPELSGIPVSYTHLFRKTFPC